MSRVVYMDRQEEIIDFAKRAAACFAEHPEFWTYADGDPTPGKLLALRWGLHGRAVLVCRLDDCDPMIFADLVPPTEARP